MHILIIPSWYPPQGGHFFKEQAEVLAMMGHKVDVVYTEYRSIKTIGNYGIKPYVVENGVSTYRSAYFKLPKLFKWNQLNYMKKHLNKVAHYFSQGNRPDVIYAQSAIWGGYIGALMAEQYQIPLIIQEQRGRFLDGNPHANELIENWQIPFIKKAYESANDVLLLTEKMKPTIQRLAPGFKGNFKCMPNMVDFDFFSLKKPLKDESVFKFLCIARLDNYKGIDILLKAFAMLENKNPGAASLEIVGDGEMRATFEAMATDLHISDKVEFKGQKNRAYIREAFHHSHCFILATKFDTFPLTALESLATGTPVIGTDSGGLKDIIREENGFLCEVNNVPSVFKAMLKMTEKYADFNSEKIRENARKLYHPEIVGKQLNDVLKKYE
jgi:L-malate glycosyltransferase